MLRAQVGNDQAFHALYQQFGQGTLRFLQSLIKTDEAEDLNQEVWLSVYRRIASLTDTSRFKTWLFQISRNRALDHFRSTKRMSEFHEILKADVVEVIKSNEEDVEFENKVRLESALEEISIKLREAVVLNYLEGMDYEEIALITGCSVGTVKSRIHNGKLKIKELIKQKLKNYE